MVITPAADIRLSIMDDVHAAELFRLVDNHKWKLTEMRPVKMSLEDIFITLVAEKESS